MPGVGSDDAVQQVKARVDLVDVVSDHVRLTRRGGRLVGLCPFHDEKTPSFGVSPQKQSWYCFGCQQGGDVFEFVEKIEKVEFRDALRLLAERAGIELQADDPRAVEAAHRRRRILDLNKLAAQYYEYVLHELPAGEPGRRLLEERAVGEQTARRFQLGFAPAGRGFADYLRKKQMPIADAIAAGLLRRDGADFFQDRLLIPIHDERGTTLAFTGRTVRADDPRKYVNTADTSAYHKGRVLFALDLAREGIDKAGHAVLMEGQFDVITAHQHGVTNAIASSGTALTEDQVRLLKRFTSEALLVFDGDKAGRDAAAKAIEVASTQGMRTRVAALDGAKDPDEFLRAAGDAAETRWAAVAATALDGWEWRMRQEVAGLRWPQDSDLMLRRIGAILRRVPADLQDLYQEQAQGWFGIPLRGVKLDKVAPPPTAPAPVGPAPRRRSAERQLLQVLAARPEVADRVRDGLPPGSLPAEESATLGKMLLAIEAGGPDGLQAKLSEFDEWEQDLVREAWVNPPPGFDDDKVVEGLIKGIQGRADKRRQTGIIQQLRAAESAGDLETAARLTAEGWRGTTDEKAG